jgi:hypothetical protein
MESRPPNWGERLVGTITLCTIAGLALFLSPGLIFDWVLGRFNDSPKGLFQAAIQDGQTWLYSLLFWVIVSTAIVLLYLRSRARQQPAQAPVAATSPFEDWQQASSDAFAKETSKVGNAEDDGWAELHTDQGCAEMLGLSGEITMDQVRAAYRHKIAEYHPDKVAALGPKLRDLAEVESKRLNVAYQHFEERYGSAA